MNDANACDLIVIIIVDVVAELKFSETIYCVCDAKSVCRLESEFMLRYFISSINCS